MVSFRPKLIFLEKINSKKLPIYLIGSEIFHFYFVLSNFDFSEFVFSKKKKIKTDFLIYHFKNFPTVKPSFFFFYCIKMSNKGM